MPFHLTPEDHIRTSDEHRRTETDDGGSSFADGGSRFASEQELQELASAWPMNRLVEIWNRLPGVERVVRFTDRKTAIADLASDPKHIASRHERSARPSFQFAESASK
jgi:hypothetical protein